MTARIAVEIDSHLPTIPTIVWRNYADLDRWAAWIQQHRRSAIAVHSGDLRLAREWDWWCQSITHLAGALEHGQVPTLYVNGPSRLGRIVGVQDLWPGQIVVLTQDIWLKAIHHQILTLSGEFVDSDQDPADILQTSVEVRAAQLRSTSLAGDGAVRATA